MDKEIVVATRLLSDQFSMEKTNRSVRDIDSEFAGCFPRTNERENA